jgi:predicted nucleic acid-binding protein
MNSPICVDAGLFIKLLIHEDLSDAARQKWEIWTLHEKRTIIAPSLFSFEVLSVLRKQVVRGRLTWEEGQAALDAFLDADIQIVPPSGELHRKAWQLAYRFNHPTAYDAYYMALAEAQSCEFWTADKRLYNSVQGQFPLLHWLGAP